MWRIYTFGGLLLLPLPVKVLIVAGLVALAYLAFAAQQYIVVALLGAAAIVYVQAAIQLRRGKTFFGRNIARLKSAPQWARDKYQSFRSKN